LLLAISVFLCLATLLVYFPVRNHEFLRIDDPEYVVQNTHVNSGLSLENIRWAFTSSHSSNWHPVTWMSHMVDCHLFGLTPGAHLMVNVGFHALNSVLLFGVLLHLTGALWRSAFVAGLFALHPLHVESVAWISERKDVLSTFFFLLTLWAYARYAARLDGRAEGHKDAKGRDGGDQAPNELSESKRRAQAYYAMALLFFVLGLMSKPMLVTLPFVLLLLDVWPLNRLALSPRTPKTGFGALWAESSGLVFEKTPFFILSVASCVVTLVSQRGAGAVVSLEQVSLVHRLENAALSYTHYLKSAVLPTNLAVFYPLPHDIPAGGVVFSVVILVGITVFVVKQWRLRCYLAMGWFWYVGTLVPVIGIVKVGEQAFADRYTYIPLIGVFIMVAWGVAEVAARGKPFRWLAPPAAAMALAGFGLLSSRQVGHWHNTRTLFEHADRVTRDNFMVKSVLGGLLREEGRLAEAKHLLLQGLQLAPGYANLNSDLGFVLIAEGAFAEAQARFEKALETAPDLAPARYGLGLCQFRQHCYAEAERSVAQVLKASPADFKAHLLMALIHEAKREAREAEAEYRAVLRLKPGLPAALRGLGGLLLGAGKTAEAQELFRDAVRQEPNDIQGRNGLAASLARTGQIEAALEQYQESLTLRSDQPLTHCAIAELCGALGRTGQSIHHYREALRLQSDLGAALNNLAWILATHPEERYRNGAEAVRLAQRACELVQNKVPLLLGTLAAAYAEAGRFEDAVKTAEQARDLARQQGLDEVAERNSELLTLYRYGRPCRQPVER